MEKYSEFYTTANMELLELIDFHMRTLVEAKKKGDEHPDDKERLRILDNYKKLVHERARQREEKQKSELEEELNLMQGRLIADCEQCGPQPVTIIGEEPHDPLGYMCDVVICSNCGAEFRNYMPNNWEDRGKFAAHFIEEFSVLNEDGISMGEILDKVIGEPPGTTLQEFEAMKKAQEVVMQGKKAMELSEEKADASLQDMYDYLFLALLNQTNNNTPPTIN